MRILLISALLLASPAMAQPIFQMAPELKMEEIDRDREFAGRSINAWAEFASEHQIKMIEGPWFVLVKMPDDHQGDNLEDFEVIFEFEDGPMVISHHSVPDEWKITRSKTEGMCITKVPADKVELVMNVAEHKSYCMMREADETVPGYSH